MSSIKQRNTRPEKRVRSLLHVLGYRFRLHRKDLPGCPDIVLPKYHTAIFVHGCFWHRHAGCKIATVPQTNQKFWADKFEANVKRDQAAIKQLEDAGWNVIVIWECETKNISFLTDVIMNKIKKAD